MIEEQIKKLALAERATASIDRLKSNAIADLHYMAGPNPDGTDSVRDKNGAGDDAIARLLLLQFRLQLSAG